MMRFLFEITERHLRPTTRRNKQECYAITDAIGTILPIDVGKYVYLCDGVVQVESKEQRARRIKKGARR